VVIMRDNVSNMNGEQVNKGKGPQPKFERNEELKRDYLSGMSVFDMATKYDMTGKRVYDILKKVGITPARYQKVPKEEK